MKHLRDMLAQCLVCSFWTRWNGIICQNCISDSKNLRFDGRDAIKVEALTIVPLWLWKPGDGQTGFVVHSLKGGTATRSWLDLAACQSLWSAREDGRPVLLVPIPSAHKRKDHAWQLANAISKVWGHAVCEALETTETFREHQKNLNRRARVQRRMNLGLTTAGHSLAQAEGQRARIVLVDDVVTTGATVLAAARALLPLRAEEVWALACRTKKLLL